MVLRIDKLRLRLNSMKAAHTSWGLVFTLIAIGVLVGIVLEAGLQQTLHSVDTLIPLALENKTGIFIALALLVVIVGMLRSREVRSR